MSLKEIGPDSILEFWFGTSRGDPEALAERNAIWFTPDEAFDQKVRGRFSSHLEQAARGEYKLWKLTPRGTLALIIIFDQFPRNIYRSTPQAFTYDERALALCRDGVAMGIDRELDVIERTFFYLPLEHAEDLNAQDKSLVCFEKLDADAPAPLKAITADYLQDAASHREIVRRFGRFPHRNLVLGRTSTPAEIEWIASDS
ncbi:MAG: DUF924 family protein [Gammaproteobacteria bacterium]